MSKEPFRAEGEKRVSYGAEIREFEGIIFAITIVISLATIRANAWR